MSAYHGKLNVESPTNAIIIKMSSEPSALMTHFRTHMRKATAVIDRMTNTVVDAI
jgi:hypothetical protein